MNKTQIISTTPIAGSGMRWAVAVTALLAVYYRLPLPFFLLVLYLSYLMCGYYWTKASCKSTVVKGSAIQNRVFAGETITLKYRFSNNGSFPLARCGLNLFIPGQLGLSSNMPLIIDPLHDGDGISCSTQQLYPSWNSCTASYTWLPEKNDVSVAIEINAGLRGIYCIPPASFFVGDPSGLFRGINLVGKEQYISVFPRVEITQDLMKYLIFEDDHREDNYGLEDRYQVLGVRDYQQGDSPKSINWYATARGGNLKTNVYNRTNSEYCLVVLDLSIGSQPAYPIDTSRLNDRYVEQAISLAAGTALYHIEQGASTAFYTNAPLLQWEKRQPVSRNDPGFYLKRTKKITTLDFAFGENQARNILELCASIDETSRASKSDQSRLWSEIMQVPASTIVYIFGYHNPPDSWKNLPDYDADSAVYDMESFYTSERLGSLRSSKIRLFDLSKGGRIK